MALCHGAMGWLLQAAQRSHQVEMCESEDTVPVASLRSTPECELKNSSLSRHTEQLRHDSLCMRHVYSFRKPFSEPQNKLFWDALC